MMKMSIYLIITSLFCTVFDVSAQERYVDDIVKKVDKETFEYAVKGGESLKLDVYYPEKDKAEERAVLVWMHGGGFAGGTRDNGDEVRFMEMAAQKGYVAVSISYRLLRKGEPTGFSCDCPYEDKINTFREASKDVWDALLFITGKSKDWNIDTDKLIVGGSSAGAEGILNAVFMKDWVFAGAEAEAYASVKPAAVFSLAGAIIDARYLDEKTAVPAVLFHGTKDNLVPYATAPHHYCNPSQPGYIWLDGSKTIASKLKELNTSYYLHTFQDARHEISSIPFEHLDQVFAFFKKTVIDNKKIQQEITDYKKE